MYIINYIAKAFTDVNEKQLREIIIEILQLKDPAYINESSREWPSDTDVIKAFSVFDQDGNGYIPVQQLKRFLLQAKLDIQEEECTYPCLLVKYSITIYVFLV